MADDIFLRFLIDRKYRIYRHLLMLLFLFIVIFNYRVEGEYEYNYEVYALAHAYLYIVIMFYINMYVFIPKVLYNKKYFLYLASLALMVTTGFYLNHVINGLLIEPHRIKPVYLRFGYLRTVFSVSVLVMSFILSSTALKLFQRYIVDNYRINELEKHALQVELKALKNQINPHFLFNMLNNVNFLIKSDPVKASLITIKLSDFLRYNLYENNQPHVFLQADIRFLTDFLNLETIRHDDFDFTIQTENILSSIQVPPNLFTTFIENAVKHSIDPDFHSQVEVSFKAVQGELIFTCSNSKPGISRPRSSSQGLGLKNIKRRLELLYDSKYTLLLSETPLIYTVELKLPI